MKQPIFRASDIRGLYPTEINEVRAVEIGRACAKLFKPGKIVVAHDTRHGSTELAQTFIDGLNQESKDQYEIIFVGLSTTPMFYFLVNELGASGGCMITASHNPKNYNGFKIVDGQMHNIGGTTIQNIVETF